VILDSSAVLAIVRKEPEQVEFAELIEQDPSPSMSAASLLECLLVAGEDKSEEVDELIQAGGISVVAFDESQARLAGRAYGNFGKGSRHPAQLNFGDCMTYALAKVTGEPLLFKGDDFTHTDVTSARG
jgi:ribonuclease VapC